MDLPPINLPVIAICKEFRGNTIQFEIKRINSKDNSRGWQWSGIGFNTYFTLEVISWKKLNQYSLFK